MSRAEILQIAGAFAAAFASIRSAVEARLVKRLRGAGATSPEGAMRLADLGRLSRWVLVRLRGAGGIVEASPGLFYLDADGYRHFRNKRRMRVLVLVAVLAFAVAVTVAISKP